MRPQAVLQYLPTVNSVADDLVRFIREKSDGGNKEIDMRAVAGRWSLESSGLLVFERRLGALSPEGSQWAEDLVRCNHNIFILSAKLKFSLPFYRYLPTRTWNRLVHFEDRFYR